MITNPKKSPVWNNFEVDSANENLTVCMICKEKVARGGNSK